MKVKITKNIKSILKNNRGAETLQIIAGIAIAVLLIGVLLAATDVGRGIMNSVIESLTGLQNMIPMLGT